MAAERGLTITISQENYAVLAALARREGRPLDAVLSAALDQYAAVAPDAGRSEESGEDPSAQAERAQAEWQDVLSDHLDNP